MGCNSSYMDANESEINLSVVYGLLDEIENGVLPENFGNGYDNRVYNKHLPKEHLDEKTEELCSKLQTVDITKYSLEMQIWWRDHQKADKKRIEKELKEHTDLIAKQNAIEKLTDYERILLGIN
jgi:hypothetical protein